jgi:hypothetical protein
VSEKPRPGLRIVGEVLLIIVSVLIAFQLEGVREERQAQSRADAQLRALLADLQDNQQRLQGVIRAQQRVVSAGRTVVRISNGNEPVPAMDSVVFAVSYATQFFRLEPVTGAYDALVASGDLRLIRNDTLRSALANFMSDVREGNEDEEISSLLRVELVGAQSESTSFLSVMRPGLRGLADLPESSTAPNIDALLTNQRYMSFLTLLTGVEGGILNYFLGLEEEVVALIQLVEAEIGEAL